MCITLTNAKYLINSVIIIIIIYINMALTVDNVLGVMVQYTYSETDPGHGRIDTASTMLNFVSVIFFQASRHRKYSEIRPRIMVTA